MKLSKITISSYRSCIRTTLAVNDDMTTLIGPNGSGKTNILSAIVLLGRALSLNHFNRGRRGSNKCIINAQLENNSITVKFRATIDYDTDNENRDEAKECTLLFMVEGLKGKSTWRKFPLDLYRAYGGSSHTRLYEVQSSTHISELWPRHFIGQPPRGLKEATDAIQFLVSTTYYSATQFSDPSKCPVSIEFDEKDQPSRRSYRINAHENFILDLYRAYQLKGPTYKNFISTVDQTGIGLIDSLEFKTLQIPTSSYEVSAGGRIRSIDRNRALVVPLFHLSGGSLSPNQLSEGTFKSLALLFYVISNQNKMLLIEEPEVCVHHGLLSSILSIVKAQAKRKQILVSTHSEFVLDHVRPENVVIVNRSNAKGTVARELIKSLGKNGANALRYYLEQSGNLGDYWREGGFES